MLYCLVSAVVIRAIPAEVHGNAVQFCFRESTEIIGLIKAGIHTKAVFWLGVMFLMQLSRLRFKQSRISMFISHIYVLGRFVNFLVIFRYIWS